MSADILYGLVLSMGLPLASTFVRRRELVVLIVLEPFDAALEHAGHEGDVVLLWRFAGRGRRWPWCAAATCSPQPLNQPQPPSESCISVRRLTPALTIFGQLGFVEDGVAVEAFPLLRRGRRRRRFPGR